MKQNRIILFAGIIFSFNLFIACKNTSNGPAVPTDNETFNDPWLNKLNEEIAKSPNVDSLYYKRAKYYYNSEIYDSCIMDLKRALDIDSLNKDYYFILSDAFILKSDSRSARDALSKVLQYYPDDKTTLHKNIRLSIILKDYTLAYAMLNHLFLVDPQDAEGYYLSGHIALDQGDSTKAISSYQRATDLDPEFRPGWVQLGDIMTAKNNPLAIRYYDNAIRLDSGDVDILHNKAYALQKLGNINESIALHKYICVHNPSYEPAFYNLGLLYMRLDSLDKAIEHFSIGAQLSPTEATDYFYRGKCYEKQGKLVEAREDYERALSFKPDWTEAKETLKKLIDRKK